MNSNEPHGAFGSPLRQRIFLYIVFSVLFIYGMRLAYLQIIQGDTYKLRAEAQAIKQVKVEPFRGNMFDRNGRVVVRNSPGFSVTVTPYGYTEEANRYLAAILMVSDSLLWAEVRKAKAVNKFLAIKVTHGRDIGPDVIAAIEERRDLLPGVDIVVDPRRLYEFDGNAAHLLGYTREVSEAQLGHMGDYYEPGDITGQTGLEKSYESLIRGQKGYQFVAVNKNGRRVASFNEGRSDINALEGFDLFLGLDLDLQVAAEKAMGEHRGGIVALDPRNGEILCFVSSPDFDLREFTGRTSRAYFNKVYLDDTKPLINRVSTPIYPPGSTWKPFMALAGLDAGVITEHSSLYCAGGYTFGNRTCKCHGGVHGSVSVSFALAKSCNAFFNQVAVKLGVERFHAYGTMFGFGQKTRVDIGEESRGILPNREYMNKAYGERGWTNYALVNWGIGQGEVSVTPLQMATYIAAIANEGTLYQPHAVRAVLNKALNRIDSVPYDQKVIPIAKKNFRIVKDGMRAVVTSGTARFVDLPGLDVCGKTGTVQVPRQKDQSWFVCFAPKDNPRIALVVTVEEGGYGAQTAGPIARKLLETFFRTDTIGVVSPDSLDSSKLQDTLVGRGKSHPMAKGPFVQVRVNDKLRSRGIKAQRTNPILN